MTEMKNFTALKRVSLRMNDTINLHEHNKQKDTLSMTIRLLKTSQEFTYIYTKIRVVRLNKNQYMEKMNG